MMTFLWETNFFLYMFSTSLDSLILKRTSWRTFEETPISSPLQDKLKEMFECKNITSPFGGNCRFSWFDMTDVAGSEKKQYGTYGMIKGAQHFILSTISESKYSWENCGYLLEYIILAATEMELGTCWLGGTFNKSNFAQQLTLKENEIIPAIVPIGLPKKRRIKENIIRKAIKAKKRLDWNKLFFLNDATTPLVTETREECKQALENVRLGPSASNKQPWRIVKDEKLDLFHFYILNEDSKMAKAYQKMRKLDIGIAVCHFDLTMQERSVSGHWLFNNPEIPSTREWKYTISWKAE
ncbi:hypothetical protein WKT22_04060 [Candidatus Lokiarchaeum ossiferum]